MESRNGEESREKTDDQGRGINVYFDSLETEPIPPLSYALGLEQLHLTMSILGGHQGWLKR